MTITRLAHTYRRSVPVDLPNGRQVWIAHEATVEASYDESELENPEALQGAHETLKGIVMEQVGEAIATEKQAILEVITADQEVDAAPFETHDEELGKMKSL